MKGGFCPCGDGFGFEVYQLDRSHAGFLVREREKRGRERERERKKEREREGESAKAREGLDRCVEEAWSEVQQRSPRASPRLG